MNIQIKNVTAQEFINKINELKINSIDFEDYVVTVGYMSGEVARRQTVIGALRDCAFDDVIMFDIRPYNEAFEPKGHSPLPKAVRSVNSDFSQWVLTRNDDEEDTTEYGQEQADEFHAEIADIADSYEQEGR